MEMIQRTFPSESYDPDGLPLTCPSLLGNTRPQLTSHGYGIASSQTVHAFHEVLVLRFPGNGVFRNRPYSRPKGWTLMCPLDCRGTTGELPARVRGPSIFLLQPLWREQGPAGEVSCSRQWLGVTMEMFQPQRSHLYDKVLKRAVLPLFLTSLPS